MNPEHFVPDANRSGSEVTFGVLGGRQMSTAE